MNTFESKFKQYTPWLENEYVTATLTILLIVYSGMYAPKIPNNVSKLFNYTLVKGIMCFLLVYVQNKNLTVSLISSVVFMGLMMLLAKFDKENMTSMQNNMKFECDCSCKKLHSMIDEVQSDDARAVANEAHDAVLNGYIHPLEAEKIVDRILNSEDAGNAVLIAVTNEGAKTMQEILDNVNNGNLTKEEGKQLAARVVVQESVLHERGQEVVSEQEQPQPSKQANVDKQMIAEEVMRRKQIVEEQQGELSKSKVQQICAQVLSEYKQHVGDAMSDILANDLEEMNFAPLH